LTIRVGYSFLVCKIAQMNGDLISIVMPTYNRAHLIGETIKSVVDQSYKNWEFIIADDGSVDDTKDVVSSFGDARIQYHYFTHGHGMIDRLRNFGLRTSHGNFIALADSDDLWLPNRLEVQIRLMKKYPQVMYSFCHAFEFDEASCISIDTVFNERNQADENVFVGKIFMPLLEGKYVAYPSVILRKEAMRQIGFMDETLKSCHGFEYFLRLASNFEGIAVNEKLMKIRKHSQSTSLNRPVASYQGSLEIFGRYYKNGQIPEKLYDQIVSGLHYTMGMYYLKSGDGALAQQRFREYISRRPLRLNGWVRLIQAIGVRTGIKFK
jgi:glycosyltransferase involved in cell wall biosynthesis